MAELDIKLDRIDIEIDGLRRIQHEETKARLERLGIDTSNYRLPPPLLASEQRCTNHLRPDDDIEALVKAARKRSSTACTASTSPPTRPPTRRPSTRAASRSSGAASARCSASDDAQASRGHRHIRTAYRS